MLRVARHRAGTPYQEPEMEGMAWPSPWDAWVCDGSVPVPPLIIPKHPSAPRSTPEPKPLAEQGMMEDDRE